MVTAIKQGQRRLNVRVKDERKEQGRAKNERKLCSLQSHQFSRKIANSHAGYSVVRVPDRLNPTKPSLPYGSRGYGNSGQFGDCTS
jgi:hypothetical protein